RKAILDSAEKELVSKMTQVNQILETLKMKKQLKQNEHALIKGTLNKLNQTNNSMKIIENKNKQQLTENDVVYISHLQSNGLLLKKQGKKWLVKVGNLSMMLPEKDLIFVKHTSTKKSEIKNVRKSMQTVSSKLDLRGFR